MKGYDCKDAQVFILSRLEKKPFTSIKEQLPDMVEAFIDYNLHFMRLTGVIDAQEERGENEYDEDEAFEYVYDAYLSDHPQDDDENMLIALLLNRFMELQWEYVSARNLVVNCKMKLDS